MGFIELADVAYALPGGWTLFEGVSFRVPEGEHTGLVGANGIGKSTLLRLIVGDDRPTAGSIQTDGRVGLMRQFIGSEARPTTVRDFLLSYAEPRVAEAAIRVAKAERWMHEHPGEDAQMRYADALANWGEAGGYETEVVFDQCTDGAFGQAATPRPPNARSRRFRAASEAPRARGDPAVAVRHRDAGRARQRARHRGQAVARGLDRREPEDVLFVSHDRTVLDRAATRIVTLEGHAAWTHHGGFSSYAEARDARVDRLDQDHRRYEAEHRRLSEMVKEMRRKSAYNDNWASKARSAQHRSTGSRSARSRPTRPTCRTSGCGSRAGEPARWRSG